MRLQGEVEAEVGGGGGAVGEFLAEEAGVEVAAVVLIADAEVEESAVGKGFSHQMMEERCKQI